MLEVSPFNLIDSTPLSYRDKFPSLPAPALLSYNFATVSPEAKSDNMIPLSLYPPDTSSFADGDPVPIPTLPITFNAAPEIVPSISK